MSEPSSGDARVFRDVAGFVPVETMDFKMKSEFDQRKIDQIN